MVKPLRARLRSDKSIRGFYEAPPLTDRNTSILSEEEPELVGEDGLLKEDVGILWVKENYEDNPEYFEYLKLPEIELVSRWPSKGENW